MRGWRNAALGVSMRNIGFWDRRGQVRVMGLSQEATGWNGNQGSLINSSRDDD